jgi:hypothetical protein
LLIHAKDAWRQKLFAACAAHAGLGRASLVVDNAYNFDPYQGTVPPGDDIPIIDILTSATNVLSRL